MGEADKLVQEGITAIKNGDKALGRGKLEAAVKLDPYNEEGWLWLARVVTTQEEKRTCLGNVIIINPQNKQAQAMLDKLEGRQVRSEEERKAIFGLQPRMLLLIGGIVFLILILLFVLMSVLGGDDSEVAALPTEFQTATNTPTPDEGQTATALASITPTLTITPSSTAALLAATWTPTQVASPTPLPADFEAPPASVPGRIIMQSGLVAGDTDNQPIVVVPAGNVDLPQGVSVEGQRGQNPALMSGMNRFAWAQYSSGTRSWTIQVQSFGVRESINVVSMYDNDPTMDRHNHPDWHDNKLVYSAQALGALGRDIWLLEIEEFIAQATSVPFGADEPTPSLTPIPPTETPTLSPEQTQELVTPTLAPASETPQSFVDELLGNVPKAQITRLTDDNSDNTWPRFDPTGTAVVFSSVTEGLTDLKVVNINSLQVFGLTENGNALIETHPDWGANNEIVFTGTTQGGENSDIYLMNADGSANPDVLIDLGGNEIKPRFSPDGNYITFSSDVNGSWDTFIYDRSADAYYSVAVGQPSIDIVNDWTE